MSKSRNKISLLMYKVVKKFIILIAIYTNLVTKILHYFKKNENKLTIEHTAGFFSTCTVILSAIVNYHNKHKTLPKIDTTQTLTLYKDAINLIYRLIFQGNTGDVFNLFFEKPNNTSENITPEPFNLNYINHYPNSQFEDYSLLNFKYLNKLNNIYFRPSKDVLKIKDRLEEKYNIDTKNTISVCYRGNDKATETGIPSYINVLEKIKLVKKENPSKKLLIQSDEIEFYEFILKKYPNSITINESTKIKNPNMATQHKIFFRREYKAKIFLAIMLIMKDSAKIILNSTNGGMWIALFRGHNEGIYQYLKPLYKNVDKEWLK